MFRPAKYVIWDDGVTDCVLVFSTHLNHKQIAIDMGIMPISAGFVSFERNPENDSIKAVVSGGSVSLKLSSRPEDAEIIAREFQIMNFKINR